MEIRNLEEEATAHGEIISRVWKQRAVFEAGFLEYRTVAGVGNRSRHALVRGQEISQQLMTRAVELFEQPHEKASVELIRAARVEDVNRKDANPSRRPVEPHRVVLDVLIDVLVWLQGDAQAAVRRLPLIGIHWVIEDLLPLIETA